MKKLHKKIYRGIEYINLSSLSSEQAKLLRQSLSDRTLIKILQDDLVIADCVIYFAYENWYNSIDQKVETKVVRRQPSQEVLEQTVLVPA